ncbi:hypothetical protein ISCGN_008887 [Ixodes scapularis]
MLTFQHSDSGNIPGLHLPRQNGRCSEATRCLTVQVTRAQSRRLLACAGYCRPRALLCVKWSRKLWVFLRRIDERAENKSRTSVLAPKCDVSYDEYGRCHFLVASKVALGFSHRIDRKRACLHWTYVLGVFTKHAICYRYVRNDIWYWIRDDDVFS